MRQTKPLEPLPQRRRRRQPEPLVPRGWIIGGTLLGLGLVVGAVWLLVALLFGGPKVAAPVQQKVAAAPVQWRGPVPGEVAERFVSAGSHEERLQWVRHPDRVGAAMEEFFSNGPGAREKVIRTEALIEVASGGMLFQEFRAELDNGKSRLLCISIDPAGAKVDFGCYAMRGTAVWGDLLSGKLESAEDLRVVIQPGSYYLRGFSDEHSWRHYSLSDHRATALGLPEGVDFYVARNSPAADLLQSASNGSAFRAMISVRSVDGSGQHRQFEITAVKTLGWVEPD
ncbi:hypothetical protein [Luteolibacter marinus]|uniref:hypothetical protein n=1 Tax=Luteolibacter marinus TaxID=2776705 RepID=UPI001868D3B0|nr:hypothetical protein [Luteolibacter marinus]